MESMLTAAGIDKNWSAREREEITERAVEIYLLKRRKTKTCEPPQKLRIIQLEENAYVSMEIADTLSDDEKDDDSDNWSIISEEEL